MLQPSSIELIIICYSLRITKINYPRLVLLLYHLRHQRHAQAEAIKEGEALMLRAEVANRCENGAKFLQGQVRTLPPQLGKAVSYLLVVNGIVLCRQRPILFGSGAGRFVRGVFRAK